MMALVITGHTRMQFCSTCAESRNLNLIINFLHNFTILNRIFSHVQELLAAYRNFRLGRLVEICFMYLLSPENTLR